MTQKLVFLISVIAVFPAITFAQKLLSPCPSIFQYDSENVVGDRWYGTITLKLDTDLAGIWLSTIFDRPFLELGTDFGEAVSRGTNKFLIRRPGHKLNIGETIKIHIFAHFDPTQGIPQLLGLQLNARVICPTNGIIPMPLASLVDAMPASPCPNLFTYEPFEADANEWSGTINVKTTEGLNGVWMRIVLDKPPIQFATNFGEAVQREPSEYLIKYPGHKVDAGETIRYQIKTSFIPGEKPPKLLGFRLNGRYVCPENGMIGPTESPAPPAPLKIQIVSPCPNLFTYEPLSQSANEWTGTINVKTDKDLAGIWMRFILDKAPIKFATNFGEAVQREPNEFLVKNPSHKLKLGETLQYKINASFIPGETPPKLVEFRLNAISVCPQKEDVIMPVPQTNQMQTGPIPRKELFNSPCPNIFTYELGNLQTDRWYGTINYRSDEDLNAIQIRIVLDKEGIQLGNWFSEVNTDDNIKFDITRSKYRLTVGQSLKLRFYIKFDSTESIPPTLKDIFINERSICQADGSIDWVTFAPILGAAGNRPIFGPDYNPISRPNFGIAGEQCGTVSTRPLALISYGVDTEEAKWPWHAALYYQTGSSHEYYCGGNLISVKHVLTVAHCTTVKHTVKPLQPNEIHVDFGKYLFSKPGRGSQHREVQNIFVHPEYNPSYYPNDISILLLSSPVDLTDWVRPICLWSENNELNSIVKHHGTVVGWGYNNYGRMTDKLLKAVMPVVSQQMCIESKKDFFSKFLNDQNFCAGFRNGTSVCIGDSGGGLVFPKSDSDPRNPVWQIRGLVSISVASQAIINNDLDICDTSHFVVFTDVAKHLDWISQVMNIK